MYSRDPKGKVPVFCNSHSNGSETINKMITFNMLSLKCGSTGTEMGRDSLFE